MPFPSLLIVRAKALVDMGAILMDAQEANLPAADMRTLITELAAAVHAVEAELAALKPTYGQTVDDWEISDVLASVKALLLSTQIDYGLSDNDNT